MSENNPTAIDPRQASGLRIVDRFKIRRDGEAWSRPHPSCPLSRAAPASPRGRGERRRTLSSGRGLCALRTPSPPILGGQSEG